MGIYFADESSLTFDSKAAASLCLNNEHSIAIIDAILNEIFRHGLVLLIVIPDDSLMRLLSFENGEKRSLILGSIKLIVICDKNKRRTH